MINLELVFPEIFLSLSIMFLLILGVFKKNSSKLIQNISLIVLLITAVITFNETIGIEQKLLFNESIILDYLSSFMKIITLIAAFVAGFTQGDGTCHNWWLLLAWICHFIYQHADGSDGPQARRLKCGSALGELVDHGADAIVTGIFPFAMAEVVGLGMDSPYFLLMYIGGMMAFFTSNMTLLHKQKQEFQDIDAQEAQQAGQMVLFILYCYTVT